MGRKGLLVNRNCELPLCHMSSLNLSPFSLGFCMYWWESMSLCRNKDRETLISHG